MVKKNRENRVQGPEKKVQGPEKKVQGPAGRYSSVVFCESELWLASIEENILHSDRSVAKHARHTKTQSRKYCGASQRLHAYGLNF